MKKNLKTTKEFINNSIGEWKSIRSTHTLAFQEFENTNSNILISYLNLNDEVIIQLLQEFKCTNQASFAIKISWESISEWAVENKSQESQTILIFLPKDKYSGTLLKSNGYAEQIPTFCKYFINEGQQLNIQSEYNSTISEERIWFLSSNVRSRYSVIKQKINKSILQTSHATEIRKVLLK